MNTYQYAIVKKRLQLAEAAKRQPLSPEDQEFAKVLDQCIERYRAGENGKHPSVLTASAAGRLGC